VAGGGGGWLVGWLAGWLVGWLVGWHGYGNWFRFSREPGAT